MKKWILLLALCVGADRVWAQEVIYRVRPKTREEIQKEMEEPLLVGLISEILGLNSSDDERIYLPEMDVRFPLRPDGIDLYPPFYIRILEPKGATFTVASLRPYYAPPQDLRGVAMPYTLSPYPAVGQTRPMFLPPAQELTPPLWRRSE